MIICALCGTLEGVRVWRGRRCKVHLCDGCALASSVLHPDNGRELRVIAVAIENLALAARLGDQA